MSVSAASSAASTAAPSKPHTEGYRDEWRSRIVRSAWVDPADLLMNPANWRIHPDRQQAAMEGALDALGWLDTIKIQDGTELVIDGHMRCALAIRRGELVFASYLDLDDDEAAAALAIIDPVGAMAERDDEKYRALVAGSLLIEEGLRAALLDEERDLIAVTAHLRRARRGDPEATPDVPAIPVVSAGEIWLLGAHVLAIGDCNDLELLATAQRALGVEAVDLIFTDPPYNANYVSRVDKDRAQPFGKIANDNLPADQYAAFLADTFLTASAALAPGGSVYVWIDGDHYSAMEAAFKERWSKLDTIVWDKEHFGMGSYYRKQHELLLFGCAGKRPETWRGGHDQRNVWGEPRDPSGSYKHPMQKPVALAQRAIDNSCPEGGTVADFFAGSGSTLVAAEAAAVRCLAVEIDPRWAEVAIRRWQDYADDEAIRLSDQVSFNDLLADRD